MLTLAKEKIERVKRSFVGKKIIVAAPDHYEVEAAVECRLLNVFGQWFEFVTVYTDTSNHPKAFTISKCDTFFGTGFNTQLYYNAGGFRVSTHRAFRNAGLLNRGVAL